MQDAGWMLVTCHEDDPGTSHVGVAAGSPAGVGVARGEFLAPGDDVLVQVEQAGALRHRVADAR